MRIVYDVMFKMLVCSTLCNRLLQVVVTAESAEYTLSKLSTSIDNIQTTADDIMSISEELTSLDNINRKLDLLGTLTEHIFAVTNKIISYAEFSDRNSFNEMKKTGLRIINVSSKISTFIKNIMLNPGSLPENAEIIVFSTEEIITLIHHLRTLSLKVDCQRAKYDKGSTNEMLEESKLSDSTSDFNNNNRKEGNQVRFEDTVSVDEYHEEVEILDSSTTVRRCSLNDKKEGFCRNEEFFSKAVSDGVCKSFLKPSLKNYSRNEKDKFDASVHLKNTEKQCTGTATSEDVYCESRANIKYTSGVNDGTCSSHVGCSDGHVIDEKPNLNELLSIPDECSNDECQKDLQVGSLEKTFHIFDESCSKEDILGTSDKKEECTNTERCVTGEDSFELTQDNEAPTSEDSPTSETHEEPTRFEESFTTESTVMPASDEASADNVNTNENVYEYSYEKIAITEPPSMLDSSEQSTQSETMEEHTTTEAYSYSYDQSTTMERSSVYDNYGYNEYTSPEETMTTESYSHWDDTVTTEQPSYYASTTTEQPETTTERDLSTLSQNLYTLAQDLSAKAQEISTVTSEISTKVSEISSALSDINTYDLDADQQNKIQQLSKLTQEISSKTSEMSSLSSETSRLASDISTASNDIPNVDNKQHPHRISPRQRITSKSQDLITSTQNIITAAQDIIVKIQDISFRSYDLKPADMISTASHDITSRTQGIITEALDIITAALEIMTSVDF